MFPNDLKKSIIQYAIEGKLVEQDINEGPAKVLIEDIIKTKEQLTKDKVIKKDKFNSYIYRDNNRFFEESDNGIKDITDQLPFEIPKSWEWVRLGSLFNPFTGNSIKDSDKNNIYSKVENGYPFIATKDVGFDGSINYENGLKVQSDNHTFKIAKKHSILICIEGGSAGKKMAFLKQNVTFGNKLCNLNCLNKFLNKFTYFYLQSTTFNKIFSENFTGIISGVSINNLKNILIPIPLNEQKRIVEKIEKIFNIIDKIQE